MAHFAKLGKVGKTVVDVVVVSNEVITDAERNEQESIGQQFLKDLYDDQEAIWLQTSYNSNFRGTFAGIRSTYDADLDKFKPPHPYPSWTWNDSTNTWDPPTPMPQTEGKHYTWNENTGSWDSKDAVTTSVTI